MNRKERVGLTGYYPGTAAGSASSCGKTIVADGVARYNDSSRGVSRFLSMGIRLMLIAMAGLPGTGKSTLATRLTKELGGVVLSKDRPCCPVSFPGPGLLDSGKRDKHGRDLPRCRLRPKNLSPASGHLRRPNFPAVKANR